MEKGKIVMICGLPGAGKTTFAKKLENENYIRFCPDEWVPSLVEDPNNLEKQMKIRTPLEKLLLSQAINLANHGMNVILENGFWTMSERNEYRDAIKKEGIRVELYYLEAPLDILWKRVEKRNNKDYPFTITFENLKEWSGSFEPVGEEEAKSYDYYKKIES